MPPARDHAHLVRGLRDVAAELDQIVAQVRRVEERVRASIGSTTTGADKQMLAALARVAGSTRGAQTALSAAASGIQKLP